MRSAIALTAVAALLMAGCARAPSAVEPTLAAVEALGYACDGGHADNVPSGLFESRCAATGTGESAGGTPTGVLVAGNDKGVMEVISGSNPGHARAVSSGMFRSLMRFRKADSVTSPTNRSAGDRETRAGGNGRAQCHAG